MRISKNEISIIHILFLLFSILSAITCLSGTDTLYGYIFILPITYFVCSFLLSNLRKRSLTVCIFDFCAFLRYVLLPLFESLFPNYGFSSYRCTNQSLITKSILFMSYELMALTLFILFLSVIGKIKHFDSSQFLHESECRFDNSSNNFTAIWIFIIISAFLVVIRPSTLEQISFIAIKTNTGTRMGATTSEASTIDLIARQFFIIAFLSLFVIFTYKLKKSNIKSKVSLNISLLMAAICTCVIISEQRSSQIYCAFAAIVLLVQLYPDQKRKIIQSISIIAIMIVLLLSAYKTLYAFKYGSYADAIAASNISFKSLTQTLEIYLLGPQTIASSFDFKAAYPQCSSISQLLFDLNRSTIGLSFFVKNSSMQLTSSSYNLFVTGGTSTSGYLLPITAQGNIVFGTVLAPVLMCLIIRLAIYIENKMFKTRSAYVSFFMAYVYIRLATCLVSSNINSVLIAFSSILISAGVIYIIQYLISKVMFVSVNSRKRKGILK